MSRHIADVLGILSEFGNLPKNVPFFTIKELIKYSNI